jgi:glycosyltransferase involved in cell wall biosynthesis
MGDCSTDESRSIISEYVNDSRLRIEFNAKNSGSTFKQLRKDVALARSRYIWIADSDDYADEQLLKILASRLDADEILGFVMMRIAVRVREVSNGMLNSS